MSSSEAGSPAPSRSLGTHASWLLLGGYSIVLPIPLVTGSVFLFASETWLGHLFGLDLLLLAVFPLALFIALRFKARWPRGRRAPWVLAAAILMASLTLALSAPRGENVSASGPRIVYLLEGERYPRFSPFNWAPEIDQVKTGTFLISALDRLIDARQSQRLRQLCMDLYRPMEAEPGWRELGTALPYGYASFWSTDFDRGHAYVYEPPAPALSSRPVLLFVHGSAGNFKSYLYVWKSFADRHGFAVVAPTFGFGNWDREGGLDALRRARDWIDRQPDWDAKRVYIAGLSNGGKGASLAVDREADRYAGVVLISAVAPKRQASEDAWKASWRHMPVLMLHGSDDDRVPFTYAQSVARDLEAAPAQVSFNSFPNEDHFLFYSKREELLQRIAAWMGLPDEP